MPIQVDNKVFPHLTPPPPDNEDQILEWSQNISRALDELNRQIVDKYNLHISGTHSHPSAWSNLRVKRPRYYVATSGGATVTVPASSSIPVLFSVNDELLEATSNLTCDLSTSGVGGLDTGSVAANTCYYLYGVSNAGSAALIASASDPDTGPSGYTAWTYLGAMPTEEGAATFKNFNACNGTYIADREYESHSTSTGSAASQVFSGLPSTARFAYFQVTYSGTSVGTAGIISGSNSGSPDPLAQYLQVSGTSIHTHGWVPIWTSQTVYLDSGSASNTLDAELVGFMEDPTEYQ